MREGQDHYLLISALSRRICTEGRSIQENYNVVLWVKTSNLVIVLAKASQRKPGYHRIIGLRLTSKEWNLLSMSRGCACSVQFSLKCWYFFQGSFALGYHIKSFIPPLWKGQMRREKLIFKVLHRRSCWLIPTSPFGFWSTWLDRLSKGPYPNMLARSIWQTCDKIVYY